MYADKVTESMRKAMEETAAAVKSRYACYNEEHGITPQTIKKEIRDLISVTKSVTQDKEEVMDFNALNKDERKAMIKKLEE